MAQKQKQWQCAILDECLYSLDWTTGLDYWTDLWTDLWTFQLSIAVVLLAYLNLWVWGK